MSEKQQYQIALMVLRSLRTYENHPNWQHNRALNFLRNIRVDILMKAWEAL